MDIARIAAAAMNIQMMRLNAAADNVSGIAGARNWGNHSPKKQAAATPGQSSKASKQESQKQALYDNAIAVSNIHGEVAYSGIDIEREYADLTSASAAYKANAKVVKASQQVEDTALDLIG